MGTLLAARVMAAAGLREILASRTVHDLVVGSDITVDDRGVQRLKGVGGVWQFLAVVGPVRAGAVISEAALGPDHPTVATIRANLDSVLEALQEATPGEDPGPGF